MQWVWDWWEGDGGLWDIVGWWCGFGASGKKDFGVLRLVDERRMGGEFVREGEGLGMQKKVSVQCIAERG